MSQGRSKYEFPIPHLERRFRPDAPAAIYLLDGAWHLAAQKSAAEARLLQAGALLVAGLTFRGPGRPADVVALSPERCLQLLQATAS